MAMYGIYGDIIGAAKRYLADLKETEELLEYPEVQADKAYYLSVLSKYNDLKFVDDRLSRLISALDDEKAAKIMLTDATSFEESSEIYGEISALKRRQLLISAEISDALGCGRVYERAYCRLRLKEGSYRTGLALAALIKADLIARGAKISNENTLSQKGGVLEISFIAEGAGAVSRLMPLTGAHRVQLSPSKSEELCFAVTPAACEEQILPSDLKIDVFHSSGAGGQNVNKVETAVRVTHIPSGMSVVCQDERSQLKNKERALETIKRRLRENAELSEKKRVDADIAAQWSVKNTQISFNVQNGTITDLRLAAFDKVKFPMTEAQFGAYLNGLTAL